MTIKGYDLLDLVTGDTVIECGSRIEIENYLVDNFRASAPRIKGMAHSEFMHLVSLLRFKCYEVF